MSVVIETTLGDITVDLYLDQRPRTCINFLKLCKVKYYNLSVFHKVKRNFIAQTGDPSQTGRGGESIFCRLYGEQAKYFDAELKPRLKPDKLGTICMVNNGNDMNGSQFFLTLAESFTSPDNEHTVFGEVVEGFETLLKINEAICDLNDRPYQDIRITHTVILHDPYEDPMGLDIPPSSPIPTKEQLQSNYIGADEEIDDTKGKNMEEIEEKIKDSEAKARATILEMVGDIPDADVKPPENVLFVCKLNPVTTSEDLEVIFSRFGPIVSCEVIKDRKTDESLQYAFIEFENEEDCENAYFKMDNVLIDDRRIHVDFSQSVSKMKLDDNNKLSNVMSHKRETLVLKEKVNIRNDYEMIFDMDDATTSSAQPNYSDQHRTKSSKYQKIERSSANDSKHAKQLSKSRPSAYGDKIKESNDKIRRRSPSFDEKLKRSRDRMEILSSFDEKSKGSRNRMTKRSPSFDEELNVPRDRVKKRLPPFDEESKVSRDRARNRMKERSPSYNDKLKSSKEKNKRSPSFGRYSRKKIHEYESGVGGGHSHSGRANDKKSNKRSLSRSPSEKIREYSDFSKHEKQKSKSSYQESSDKLKHSSSKRKHSERTRQSSTSSDSSSSSSSSDSSSQSDEKFNTRREKHRDNFSRSEHDKQKYKKSISSIKKHGNPDFHSKQPNSDTQKKFNKNSKSSESKSFSMNKRYDQNYSSRYKQSHKKRTCSRSSS